MAGVAQLVRASVCGTECRQFESGHPPHKIQTRKNAGFNFIMTCAQILELAVASSTRRREANGSMPVRKANEPRECSDSEAILSPDADFHRSEARVENRANRVRAWKIVYRGMVTRPI